MEKDNKIKNILIITLIVVIIISLLAVIFLPKIILNNKFNNCNVTYLKSEGKILKREYDRINPRDVLL